MGTIAAQIGGAVAKGAISKVISDKIGGGAKSSGADYAASRAAAEYSPWEVSGNYFGTANFDKENKTASYELSPELQQIRDMYFGKALQGIDEQDLTDAQSIQDYGMGRFTEASQRDIMPEANKYYSDMQSIMAPGRATQQQQLAQNLFASGRMGQATAASEGGGYVNPERMEYLTSINRQNRELAMDSYQQAQARQDNDLKQGLAYQGLGMNMGMTPYSNINTLFGYGTGVEQVGQGAFNQGLQIGTNAVPGQGYGAGLDQNGNIYQNQARGSQTGMFTDLLNQGVKGIGSIFGGGGGTTGYSGNIIGGGFSPSGGPANYSSFASAPYPSSLGG
jgi:hypothetical protein|tara:strand:+ start:5038 stop:6042 length:1005 start_codon:yes stop_codon:yes gene_type:complete